jgi:hypothetical protein
VTGSAEESVVPDKAELYITVETLEDTASLSQDTNSGLSDAVVKALQTMGVSKDDIETDNYNIAPKEMWDEKNGEMKQLGYTTTHTLKVTTRDIMNTGGYVDAAVKAGANRVERVIFSLTKEKEKQVSQALLTKASQDAKDKAGVLAQSIGVKLGKITTVSESSYNVMPYVYSRSEAAYDGKAQINPSEVKVNAFVSLVYQI